MHIVNMMFSRIGGGIEQAFVDYCEGLRGRRHKVTAITRPSAVINAQLKSLGMQPVLLDNFGEWDIFASRRLRKILDGLSPDIVIASHNRAFSLGRRAIKDSLPLVAIAQNYNTRRFNKADAMFTTTQDLIDHLAKQGIARDTIYHIPNMIRCHELPYRREHQKPPVIGTMGRFVKKKGFDVYIDALKILKDRGYDFRALLGGIGPEDNRLRARATAAGLDGMLSFLGWVDDKKAFYTGIDIFCLPSLHEPFGIVLLEAFVHGTPVIATDSEGPRDIIKPNVDALIVSMGSATQMADAIAQLLDNPQQGDDLAANAFAKAKSKYTIEAVAGQIESALDNILARHRL